MPSSACPAYPLPLHPFPTRRSSDLDQYARPAGISARSCGQPLDQRDQVGMAPVTVARQPHHLPGIAVDRQPFRARDAAMRIEPVHPRSEEHTSELQSLTNLVCRLLLVPPTRSHSTLSLHDALPISTNMPGQPASLRALAASRLISATRSGWPQ